MFFFMEILLNPNWFQFKPFADWIRQNYFWDLVSLFRHFYPTTDMKSHVQFSQFTKRFSGENCFHIAQNGNSFVNRYTWRRVLRFFCRKGVPERSYWRICCWVESFLKLIQLNYRTRYCRALIHTWPNEKLSRINSDSRVFNCMEFFQHQLVSV